MTNKWLYSLVIVGVFLAFSVGVFAYQVNMQAGNPSIMGHSAGEIHVEFKGVIMTLQDVMLELQDPNVSAEKVNLLIEDEVVNLQDAFNTQEIVSKQPYINQNDCHLLSPQDGGSALESDVWNTQCNDGYAMVAIWDDNDGFDDVDNIKCCKVDWRQN